jgi:hypothetical protein
MKKNLIGKRWGQLSSKEQKELLSIANTVDARSGNIMNETGECIIDFDGTEYSVSGKIVSMEDEYSLEIDDSAIIYNSSGGIIEDDLIG